jgi:hypothetical protein
MHRVDRADATRSTPPLVCHRIVVTRLEEAAIGDAAYDNEMTHRSAAEQLSRLTAEEREREDALASRLLDGEQLSREEILGTGIDKDTAVYPIGLFEEEFLPLSLATSRSVLVRMPCEFTLAEYEELLGFDFGDFVELIDRGIVTPILNEYTFYADQALIAPIVLERRPHIPEQRIRLEMLGSDQGRWQQLATGLKTAQGLFPSHELVAEDAGESISFKGVHVAYASLCALGLEESVVSVIQHFAKNPTSSIYEPMARLTESNDPEVVLFALVTLLSAFMTDAVVLGATGQMDRTFEAVIRLPDHVKDDFTFLPVHFGRRLIDWIDLSIPRRLESQDIDELLNSGLRDALLAKMMKFNEDSRDAEFLTAADEGIAIREDIRELDKAYRRMRGARRTGAVLSAVSFAAVPLTLASCVGLMGAAVGTLVSAGARAALAKLQGEDLLANKVFARGLTRVGRRPLDAATYQICVAKAAISPR